MGMEVEIASSLELYKADGQGSTLVQALIFNFLFKKLTGVLPVQLNAFTSLAEGY